MSLYDDTEDDDHNNFWIGMHLPLPVCLNPLSSSATARNQKIQFTSTTRRQNKKFMFSLQQKRSIIQVSLAHVSSRASSNPMPPWVRPAA